MHQFTSDPAYFLLQIFISDTLHGIFEVYVEVNTGRLCCTCPGWAFKERFVTPMGGWCIHTDEVDGIRELNNGEYPIEVVQTDFPLLTEDIVTDRLAYRDWMIHNTKVLVS